MSHTPRLHGDFETRSRSNIQKEGAPKYAADPSTEILCFAYAFDDEPVTVIPILRGYTLPERVEDHVRARCPFVAHNAPFESVIWNTIGYGRHGWPYLYTDTLDCTMARAYAMAFPGSLENAAAAAGLDMQKDMAGHRLMLKLSQPRPDGSFYEPEDYPDDFERLYRYCGNDVDVERALDKRLLPLCEKERRVWQLDFEINARGIYVDSRAVETAALIVEKEQVRLNKSIRNLTNDEVGGYNCHAQLKRWIISQSVVTEGVGKNDVSRLLSDPALPHNVRSVLLVRQEAAKSSVAKLKAFSSRAGADSRIRGILQYHGAQATGRWAGRGLQPHNFPRKTTIAGVFELLQLPADEAAEAISMVYGRPMSIISDQLRAFLTAAPGKILVGADWSSIEARMLAWLAGEESALHIFRTSGKIYEHAAAQTFGVKMESIGKNDIRRQIGKVETLALGFQGGVGAFMQMAKTYGLQMSAISTQADYLWSKAPSYTRERAARGWKDRGKASGLEKREWMACELIKLAWRAANPQIVKYWADVEAAAINAVKYPGEEVFPGVKEGNVSFKKRGSFLFCKLPSGRRLCYPYPEVVTTETPWGEERDQLRYKGEDTQIHKWVRFAAYGGLLVENITQAAARDLLAEAMLRVNEKWPIVLHVHDELVAEITCHWHRSNDAHYGQMAKIAFEEVCNELPEWAEGLPIAAEGWINRRYVKQ